MLAGIGVACVALLAELGPADVAAEVDGDCCEHAAQAAVIAAASSRGGKRGMDELQRGKSPMMHLTRATCRCADSMPTAHRQLATIVQYHWQR